MEDDIATDPEETVEDVEKKTAEILALQAEEEKKKQANFCASSIKRIWIVGYQVSTNDRDDMRKN